MASTSAFCSKLIVRRDDAVFLPRTRSFSYGYESSSLGFKLSAKPFPSSTRKAPPNRPGPFSRPASNPISASSDHSFDVVVIGAGIIGLTVARQFLIGSDLSVAVVDKAVPCSGATGAGQGYLWIGHKTPGTDIWELAMRSHELWVTLAESLHEQGLNPLQHLGWKNTGSMLIGRTPEDLDALKRRVTLLQDAGVRAEFLSAGHLLSEEPDLLVDETTGAAFVPGDCQLDAQRAAAFFQKVNRHFSSEGRYAEFFYDPVTSLLRSNSSGEIIAVRTSKNTLYSKKAIVVAAGCWSGSLMHDLFKESEIVIDVPVKPRKGHLLVLENFDSLKVSHGLMEAGYVNHQNAAPLPTIMASEAFDHGQTLSISMTATMDSIGNLVLGSSRQFVGFNTEVEESIVSSILNRAIEFFPKLGEQPFSDFIKSRKVRTGLRPYMPDGKPVIGPVPGMPNLFLATGHEGNGLSMALGTAEMVADMVLGNSEKVDYAAFAVQGRCC